MATDMHPVTQREEPRKRTQELSQSSTTLLPAAVRADAELRPALMRLCSSKNQTQFTGHSAETWMAALSIFNPADARAAILEMATNADPFPDLNKVLIAADKIRRERDGTQQRSNTKTLSSTMKQAIAKSWGLSIER